MSMFVFGDIILNQGDIDLECVALDFSRTAHSLSIHMKFGGNVSNQYIQIAPSGKNKLPFEITDSIIENTATLLFALPNENIYEGSTCLINRPWAKRMAAIQSLLSYILMQKWVVGMTLNIGISSPIDIHLNRKDVSLQNLPDFLAQLYRKRQF